MRTRSRSFVPFGLRSGDIPLTVDPVDLGACFLSRHMLLWAVGGNTRGAAG